VDAAFDCVRCMQSCPSVAKSPTPTSGCFTPQKSTRYSGSTRVAVVAHAALPDMVKSRYITNTNIKFMIVTDDYSAKEEALAKVLLCWRSLRASCDLDFPRAGVQAVASPLRRCGLQPVLLVRPASEQQQLQHVDTQPRQQQQLVTLCTGWLCHWLVPVIRGHSGVCQVTLPIGGACAFPLMPVMPTTKTANTELTSLQH
jgi:hypothetical protein